MSTGILSTDVAMDQDRVEWHLWNWERWQQHCRMPGYLPNRASGGMRGYGTPDPQDCDDELDRQAGKAVQAVLDGMGLRLRLAVYVRHGVSSAVYWVRGNIDDAYTEACAIIAVQLDKRGFC